MPEITVASMVLRSLDPSYPWTALGNATICELPGGGTRYIPGWEGAARPLIPWPCLGTGHYLPSGRATIFWKSGWKKIWPSPSTWQKKLWPSPSEGWKKLWPSPISFFYIFISFSLTKTIFFTRRCAPSSFMPLSLKTKSNIVLVDHWN